MIKIISTIIAGILMSVAIPSIASAKNSSGISVSINIGSGSDYRHRGYNNFYNSNRYEIRRIDQRILRIKRKIHKLEDSYYEYSDYEFDKKMRSYTRQIDRLKRQKRYLRHSRVGISYRGSVRGHYHGRNYCRFSHR